MGRNRSLSVQCCLVIVCAALLGACGDDDDASGTEPNGADLTAFCENAPDPAAEVPERYVGSSDHVDDLQTLGDAAPAELIDDLDLIVGHFEEAVDPADPDSQLTENFPARVNAAIERVTTSIDENCVG